MRCSGSGVNGTAISGAALGGLLVAGDEPGGRDRRGRRLLRAGGAVPRADAAARDTPARRLQLPATSSGKAGASSARAHGSGRSSSSSPSSTLRGSAPRACSARWSLMSTSAAPPRGARFLRARRRGCSLGGVLMLRLRPQRMLLAATLGIFLTLPVLVAARDPDGRGRRRRRAPSSPASGSSSSACSGTRPCSRRSRPNGCRGSTRTTRSARSSSSPSGWRVVGPVADAIGTRETLLLAAALSLLATLAVLASRDVRTLRRRVPLAEPAAA